MDKLRKIRELKIFAESVRLLTLKQFANTGFGHIGGAMSVVEAVAVLYGAVMRFDPNNPSWPQRDKLVVSKGHAGPTIYSALALKGFFPESMLRELNQGGGRLPSHCDRNKTPGIDMTTGSLGQGVSVAAGIALGDRLNAIKRSVFVLVGDGELNEGQNWEAFMFAAHFKLSSLCVLIDANGLQLDGFTRDVLDLGSIADKMRAFGFVTREVNGHSVEELLDALSESASNSTDLPSAIIMHTVKGHSVSFAENTANNHHMTFSNDLIMSAVKHCESTLDDLRRAAFRA